MSGATKSAPRPVIGVSIGDSDDLARLGLGPEHLDDLAARIVRMLFGLGFDIAYGGVFRSQGFTNTLMMVARGIQDKEAEQVNLGDEVLTSPPLINYQAWPYYAGIDEERVAQTYGLCRYVKIDPDDGSPPAPTSIVDDEKRAFLTAKALTRMRAAMTKGGTALESLDGEPTPPTCARILLGGRVNNWQGIMPGIPEEAAIAVEAGQPIYVLGGFGGGAGIVRDALLNRPDVPVELTYEHYKNSGGAIGSTRRGFDKQDALKTMKDAFRRAEKTLCSNSTPDNGLSSEEQETLMKSEDAVTIMQLIRKGLLNINLIR